MIHRFLNPVLLSNGLVHSNKRCYSVKKKSKPKLLKTRRKESTDDEKVKPFAKFSEHASYGVKKRYLNIEELVFKSRMKIVIKMF